MYRINRWVWGIFLGFIICGSQVWETPVYAETKAIEVERLEVGMMADGPAILLFIGESAIPIFVDITAATAVQGILSGRKFPRPLSHGLMHTILEYYEIKLIKVFITLHEGIYFGTLTFSHNGKRQVFDSRSSDAIAMALYFQSPIFVENRLLEEAGKPFEENGRPFEPERDVDL
jgi:uncharacterized protein